MKSASPLRALGLVALIAILTPLSTGDVPGVSTPALSVEPHRLVETRITNGEVFSVDVAVFNIANLKEWQFTIRGTGETIVYDNNTSNVYDSSDRVIGGPIPIIGSLLKDETKLKYRDDNGDSVWSGNSREQVIYDSDGDNRFDLGEAIVFGNTSPPIAAGTPLKDDPKIKYFDDNNNAFWGGMMVDIEGTTLGAYWSNLLSIGKAGGVIQVSGEADHLSNTILVLIVVFSSADAFSGSTSLALPAFKVLGIGSRSVLHVFNDKLINTAGKTIMHDTLDGFFSNISNDNAPPQPSFIWAPTNASAGQAVSFNATASRDPEDMIASYNWDFGDGTKCVGCLETETHTYAAAGDYVVNLTATAGGQTTPALGVRENVVRITAPVESHDVAVTGLTVSRDFAYEGVTSQPIKVDVTVANQGSSSETFTVTARASANIIGTQTITLAAGTTMIVPFNWNAHLLSRGTYTLSAEASTVAGETDLADNLLTDGSFTVRLKGDVNNDCTVNVLDLVAIGGNFNKPASARPEADINNDGVINILDLVVVGGNFGKTCA